ncbi:MAG: hypothetical protein IPP48_13410 [Chitinophagaceae bacterium]|nr:hypothetical protein [Chitinophagaceae bacterium]
MSKKTKGQKINVPHTATVVAKGNLKAATMPAKEANGMGFMAYGLLAVVCILPFLFSKVTADPVVCVRFTALSIFVFAAGLFFYCKKIKQFMPYRY